MFTVAEALQAVLQAASPLPSRPRPLIEALGCILAEDITADIDLPPFDKAIVDGYAVRTDDLRAGNCRLRIGEEAPAGRTPSRPLDPREAAVIMTGAPLPLGADAVVMIEKTRREDDAVVIEDPRITPGRNWMPRGREMRAGDVVLRAGQRLNPLSLGLLASVGKTDVPVVPRPRVLIVPTGDELVEPGQVPGPGQIRNSNAVVLQAFAESSHARAEVQPIAPDDLEPLSQALKRGLDGDVLLITGGVSAGNRDLVPASLEQLGVERVFHKVRVKPGKPLWFGVGPERDGRPGALVFGLPGNPVSGVVGFLLFVRPALEALSGRLPGAEEPPRFPLARSFAQTGDRPTYFPAQWVEGTIEPLNWGGSADLRTVAAAEGFAIFPAGDRTYAAGEVVGWLDLR